MPPTECLVDGCRKIVIGRGWCSVHYNRWWNHGNPLGSATAVRRDRGRALFEYAKNTATDDCIFWAYPAKGYGQARRMCAEITGKKPSPRHGVAHSCGKGHLGCINSRHLRWATQKENLADRIIHGTANRGEKHGFSKLTSEQVLRIRSLLSEGASQKSVADLFGIGQTTVSHIHRKDSWAWL